MGTVLMLATLILLMWFQIFLAGAGRGLKETYCHYIYMVPEKPFMKIVWSNLEVILKAFVEGALISLAAGIAAGAGILLIVFFAATYTLFVFMLIAINFVFMRFTGVVNMNAGLLVFIYMFAVMLVMAPGIAAAIAAGINFGAPWALAALSGWELIAALVCFRASRDILHNCDMISLRATGI